MCIELAQLPSFSFSSKNLEIFNDECFKYIGHIYRENETLIVNWWMLVLSGNKLINNTASLQWKEKSIRNDN